MCFSGWAVLDPSKRIRFAGGSSRRGHSPLSHSYRDGHPAGDTYFSSASSYLRVHFTSDRSPWRKRYRQEPFGATGWAVCDDDARVIWEQLLPWAKTETSSCSLGSSSVRVRVFRSPDFVSAASMRRLAEPPLGLEDPSGCQLLGRQRKVGSSLERTPIAYTKRRKADNLDRRLIVVISSE